MTAAHSVPATQPRSIPTPEEPGTEPGAALAIAGMSAGVLAYIAACAVAFALDWRIAIPVVLVAGIAVVVAADRRLTHDLVVDEAPDAFEQLLLSSAVTADDGAPGDRVPTPR